MMGGHRAGGTEAGSGRPWGRDQPRTVARGVSTGPRGWGKSGGSSDARVYHAFGQAFGRPVAGGGGFWRGTLARPGGGAGADRGSREDGPGLPPVRRPTRPGGRQRYL